MTTDLTYIERLVSSYHKSTLIWLHGLGDSGQGHESFARELSFPDALGVKFIFPNAPSMPVSVNGGMVMPAWYDILAMDIGRKIDEEGIEASAQKISTLIKREVAQGIDSKKIILVGFSQGGAVALQTALKYPVPLGGIVCLSTYLGVKSVLSASTTPINQNIPIFWGHGTHDSVVRLPLAKQSIQALKDHHYEVTYREYEMEHSIHPDEVVDINQWLVSKLA